MGAWHTRPAYEGVSKQAGCVYACSHPPKQPLPLCHPPSHSLPPSLPPSPPLPSCTHHLNGCHGGGQGQVAGRHDALVGQLHVIGRPEAGGGGRGALHALCFCCGWVGACIHEWFLEWGGMCGMERDWWMGSVGGALGAGVLSIARKSRN